MVELALIAALFGIGAYITTRKSSTSPTSGSGQRVITLDEAISDSDRDAVIQAVLYTVDPTALDTLSSQMTTAGLPCASYECSFRAWELRGASGPPPQRPTACATVAETSPTGLNVPGVPPEVAAQACALLDPSLDVASCSAVLTALATETDASKLLVFSAALAPTHPKAAGALAAKAQILQGQVPQPGQPGQPGQPAALRACPGLDASITADQCAAIVNALLPTTIDPSYVQSVAAQFPAATYPLAAAAFAAKLGSMQQSSPPPPPPTTAQSGQIYEHPTISDRQPMEPAIAAAAALSPKYEGSTAHTEGTAAGAMAQAAAVAVAQAGQPVGTPSTEQVALGSPSGFWQIQMRVQDTPWPMTIAKIGSGGKSAEALSELYGMNPHLHSFPGSGVVASFKPGDMVNVPGAWKDALIRKGFKLVAPGGKRAA